MYTSMRRLLSPRSHGILDFLVVVFLLLSPLLFDLQEPAATFAYVLAGIHLILTVLTAFPMGLIKIIPLRIHGLIEVLVSVFLVFSPYIIGFTEDPMAIWFFPVFGLVVLLVFLISDYNYPKELKE